MEEPKESQYEVIITDPAEIRFYELIDYLYDHYSLEKAEKMANEIRDSAKTLKYYARRGALEPRLRHRKENYRFILYNRTKRAEVKIIYFILEQEGKVFVTDFFPTEKEDLDIKKRN